MAEAKEKTVPVSKDWDAQAGSNWRSIVFLLPIYLYAFVVPFIGILWSLISLRHFRRNSRGIVRWWGKVPLWLWGVKLEVHGAEKLETPGAKILAFNHVALLDLWVLTAVWPPRASALYKIEFHSIPIWGRALRALDLIAVDRRNRERGIQSIRQAAEHVRKREAIVLIAPEGTRSRKGGLQKFKTGPFHLAVASQAPLIPMVLRGVEQLNPMGKFLIRSGKIRIDFLDPISTEDWKSQTVRAHAQEVRQVFLEYLEPAPDEARD
ncbi:MAG: 1-acyl-sn-glycerol-3-phosphate acyltransferase [Planctomycetota bacterium]|nr:MAG: 1-acyl-sn-glycerol-3-phosphate acyltransferase [Planctomycetota bacterium]